MAVILIFAFVIVELTKESSPTLSDMEKLSWFVFLAHATPLISSTLDLEDLMPLVMDKAKNIMDAEACSILFYNKETNKLEFEVALCKTKTTSEILKKKITLDMGQGME